MLPGTKPQAPWLWTFAAANGLKYEEDPLPSARGTDAGRGVSAMTYVVEARNEDPYPKLRVEIDLHGNVPDDIECCQYTWPNLYRWMPWLFGASIKTGDDEFDQKIWVKSEHADRVLAYLTPDRRRAVSELLELSGKGASEKTAMMTGGKWRGNDLGRARLIFVLDVTGLGGADFAIWLAERYNVLMSLAPRLDGDRS